MRYYYFDIQFASMILNVSIYLVQTREMMCFVFFPAQELLQLEDRIGSVSTALSEEQIANCLSRNVYKRIDRVLELNIAVVDDIKCSICQVFLASMDDLFSFVPSLKIVSIDRHKIENC
jgi:hypothetical protein